MLSGKNKFHFITLSLLGLAGIAIAIAANSNAININHSIAQHIASTQNDSDTLLLGKLKNSSKTGLLQLLSVALIAFGVYMIRKAIRRTNQIKCPKCNTWFKKGEPVRETFLGTETVKKRKKDVEYIRVDGGKKHRIEHEYYVNEEQSNYRAYYNCPKCKQLLYVDHH